MEKVIIYGAGYSGKQIYNELDKSKYEVVCFIDDNKKLQNIKLFNIPILSMKEFVDKKINIDLAIIAIPTIKKDQHEKIYFTLNNAPNTEQQVDVMLERVR